MTANQKPELASYLVRFLQIKSKFLLIALSLILLLGLFIPAAYGLAPQAENPLLSLFETPHQTPPFDQIKTGHFVPAIKAAMEEKRGEIEGIVNNPAAPDFANTIEALERSGRRLDRITNILFNLSYAETNAELQAVARDISPLLTDFSNDIMLNEKLFDRVKYVYDNCERKQLPVEQNTLLEKTYNNFIRNGILLTEEQKEKYRDISRRLSELTLTVEENILSDTNNYYLQIENPADLSGLPESAVETAAENAEARELKGWVFTLDEPGYVSFMQYADNRQLRAEMYKVYQSRGGRGNENDNSQLIRQIANLRLEKANLLGYPSHAHYVLADRMAETPVKVNDFQNKLLYAALPAAKNEVNDMRNFAGQSGGGYEIQPYDWPYYETKLKSETYAVQEEELRPYFQLEKVRDGIFGLAGRLYGLQFVANEKIPVYHPDVAAYEVFGAGNQFLGVLYLDYFPREGKSGGAWCTEYSSQEKYNGQDIRPQASVVYNFTRPTTAAPALLTIEEVSTFLHEFGHALHSLFSDVTYSSLSAHNAYWDFVEFPSQIMENWTFEKEFLNTFATHYQTGEQIPDELLQKITGARTLHSAFTLVNQLRYGILDMAWHSITAPVTIPAQQFERQAVEETTLLPIVEDVLISTRFTHIFSGGYDAGYYGYNWADVLAADAYQLFKENGVFDQETAAAFREHILARGATEHPAALYRNFRGREATIEALLDKLNIAYSSYLPEGFVHLDEVIPNAVYDIRYYGENNFVGGQVDGYFAPRAILTGPAAQALKKVQQELNKQGLGLKIFDAYRPQRAVDHFARWAADTGDTKMKKRFYPDVDKKDLFALGYIAYQSGHSRGSTVDLTVIRLAAKEELDMGSTFDFFGPISHHDTQFINEEQARNRKLLKDVMDKYGFNSYDEEWWHYTLKNEPYSRQYFDFPVD